MGCRYPSAQGSGTYEILSAIGTGGMGEVYRARDTKLIREVAIKVLPESFAHDAERLARFTREAQTLASLNHPNIAAIYGIEDCPEPHPSVTGSQHIRALVMELQIADPTSGQDLDVLALHEALDEMAGLDPRQAEIVERRMKGEQ
jgi:serine/threonine protein kinase